MSEERTFGPYTLLHPPLGAGGMAITYKARERLELGGERIVVVKQILPRWAADKRFRQMFLDEARLSSLLNHNNICRIYKGGRIGDTLFLAMEFVDGTDLLTLIQRLRKRGLEPLPLAHALYIIEQVLQGLEAAHAATDTDGEFLNLVHRDVSPHNVLIGSRGDVKLIDFGVAKSRSNMSRTADGAVKGKVAYASPEQILRLALDRRSDLFAAGLLLYKLTTGIHPLAGTDQLQTFSRFHRYTKGTITIPPPSHQSSTALPQRLDDVVMRALAIDREERYQTADAMALAVGDLLRELFPRYRPKTFRSFTAWALESSAGAYIPAPETLPNLTLDVWTSDDTAVWDPLPTDKPPQRAAPLLEPDDPVWNIDTSEPPTLLRGSAPWDEIKRAVAASDPPTEPDTEPKPAQEDNVIVAQSDDDTLLDYDLQFSLQLAASAGQQAPDPYDPDAQPTHIFAPDSEPDTTADSIVVNPPAHPTSEVLALSPPPEQPTTLRSQQRLIVGLLVGVAVLLAILLVLVMAIMSSR